MSKQSRDQIITNDTAREFGQRKRGEGRTSVMVWKEEILACNLLPKTNTVYQKWKKKTQYIKWTPGRPQSTRKKVTNDNRTNLLKSSKNGKGWRLAGYRECM